MEPFDYVAYLASGDIDPVFSEYTPVTQLEEQTTPEDLRNNRTKSSNFSEGEDKDLVTAWLNIGSDAAVGNQQNRASFWGRVHDLYKQTCVIEKGRTRSSLEHRWTYVQQNVSKFCGCMDQVQRLNRSGGTEQDKVNTDKDGF